MKSLLDSYSTGVLNIVCMSKIEELVKQASYILKCCGSDSPMLDTVVILASVLGKTKEWIFTHPDEQLGQEACQNFWACIDRRASGEPVSYIVGHREFMGLDFLVTHDVYIPSPDTECLVEAAIADIKKRQEPILKVLDVGVGPGTILLSVAVYDERVKGVGTDISPQAIEVARMNAKRFGVQSRVELICTDIANGIQDTFDIIVANLPYVDVEAKGKVSKSVSQFMPRQAIFAEEHGLAVIKRLIDDLWHLIHGSSSVYLECDPLQVDILSNLLQQILPHCKIYVLNDLAGRPRCVAATPKGLCQ
jgi:release factor glutamine methyltransferase